MPNSVKSIIFSGHNLPALHLGQNPFSRPGLEFFRTGQIKSLLLGFANDRLSQGMLGTPFRRSCQAQHHLFLDALGCHVCNIRSAQRQSAGLVKSDNVELIRGFQSFAALDKYAQFCSPADADSDGRGSGQAQSTGAGYY